MIPYLFAGGGYVLEDSNNGHFQIPAGIGFNFRAWKRAFINVQAAYRISPTTDERNNLELGLGFIVNLGKIDDSQRDTDGDGVLDIVDKCPKQKGAKTAQGCPDKDGDGAPDNIDNCPNIPGPLKGCPDRDKDGIADKEDECPDIAGVEELNGCPQKGENNEFNENTNEGVDTDGDGCSRCP